jgi:hypothetical protein
MNANIRAFEYQTFVNAQHEFSDAVQSGDTRTARLALAEIESAWMHTDWPRLRDACAAFLRRHLEYAEPTAIAI